MGSRFNPTMGRTCSQCVQGTDERIVARQEGWVKVPRGVSQDDPPYGVFGTGTELAARQALDLNQHITVRLMVKLSDEDRADLLAAVQRWSSATRTATRRSPTGSAGPITERGSGQWIRGLNSRHGLQRYRPRWLDCQHEAVPIRMEDT